MTLYHMFHPQKLIKIIGALLQLSQTWESLRGVHPNPKLTFYEPQQDCFFSKKEISFNLLTLPQECDRVGYQKKTKFLAKTYFDIAVVCLPHFNQKRVNLYLMTALSLAIKFNECRAISDQMNPQALSIMSGLQFSTEDFISAQMDMLEMLEFRLSIASPYDFAELYQQIARLCFRKTRQAQIETIIDYAITIPTLSLQPSRRLFLGCLLNILEKQLGEKLPKSLESLFLDEEWDEIKRVSGVVKKNIEQTYRELDKRQTSG